MARPKKKVTISLDEKEYRQIAGNAARRGRPLASFIREAALQYIRLKDEHEAFLAAAGEDEESASVVHSLIAKSEQRLVATMDQLSAQIHDLRVRQAFLTALMDRTAYTYLVHTPELPEDTKHAAIAAADRRYEKLLRATEQVQEKY